jgi:hypothetical protein
MARGPPLRAGSRTASYTWSRNLDSTSEGVGTVNNQSSGGNRTRFHRRKAGSNSIAAKDDRTHRLSILYVWMSYSAAASGRTSSAGGRLQASHRFKAALRSPLKTVSPASLEQCAPRPQQSELALTSRAISTPPSGSRSCVTGYRNPTRFVRQPSRRPLDQGVDRPMLPQLAQHTPDWWYQQLRPEPYEVFPYPRQRHLMFRLEAFNASTTRNSLKFPKRAWSAPRDRKRVCRPAF